MSYFECEHCLMKFAREGNFKKHSCRQMKRNALLKKPIGITAYSSYCDWLTYKGFKVHSSEQFIDSRLFTSFVLFTRYATKIALPAKDRFIEYMVELDIHPRDWTGKVVYEHFMESFDQLFTADDQFDISLETVYELGKNLECETGDIFLYMEPGTVIGIIQAKKFSPWFLLNSRKFKNFMQTEMTREQKILLDKYIDIDKWESMFNKCPKRVSRFKKNISEIGL